MVRSGSAVKSDVSVVAPLVVPYFFRSFRPIRFVCCEIVTQAKKLPQLTIVADDDDEVAADAPPPIAVSDVEATVSCERSRARRYCFACKNLSMSY